ncbi:hypothetical protein [Pseudarthrobacter sp. fls2-241-R2A-168]|uniref:hypothetical protein n=1 Tax=Pseudarthrobacter sp. fls2-241-R2A-168 TaxID=3040304 RepID=UPI00255395EE|nr:hypothetical protein [Pseudarthrobacter sp. fls2-241-R2A-168]
MSALVTFTELGSPDIFAGRTSLNGFPTTDGPAGLAAVHCGTSMELVTPAVGPAAVGYTFGPDDGGPVQLPPVWRCGCGFQLDAGLGAAHIPALSA